MTDISRILEYLALTMFWRWKNVSSFKIYRKCIRDLYSDLKAAMINSLLMHLCLIQCNWPLFLLVMYLCPQSLLLLFHPHCHVCFSSVRSSPEKMVVVAVQAAFDGRLPAELASIETLLLIRTLVGRMASRV